MFFFFIFCSSGTWSSVEASISQKPLPSIIHKQIQPPPLSRHHHRPNGGKLPNCPWPVRRFTTKPLQQCHHLRPFRRHSLHVEAHHLHPANQNPLPPWPGHRHLLPPKRPPHGHRRNGQENQNLGFKNLQNPTNSSRKCQNPKFQPKRSPCSLHRLIHTDSTDFRFFKLQSIHDSYNGERLPNQ